MNTPGPQISPIIPFSLRLSQLLYVVGPVSSPFFSPLAICHSPHSQDWPFTREKSLHQPSQRKEYKFSCGTISSEEALQDLPDALYANHMKRLSTTDWTHVNTPTTSGNGGMKYSGKIERHGLNPDHYGKLAFEHIPPLDSRSGLESLTRDNFLGYLEGTQCKNFQECEKTRGKSSYRG